MNDTCWVRVGGRFCSWVFQQRWRLAVAYFGGAGGGGQRVPA